MSDESPAAPLRGRRRAVVDRDACMGSGNCVYWAPAVFKLDADGIAEVCGDVGDHEEQVELARSNCPTSAISVEGDGG